MIDGRHVLAVVPARSGSKGIPDKNMRAVGGVSLIGRAAQVLKQVPEVDCRIISTDSARYAEEAARHGLEAPFLRPHELSHDRAGAVETMCHALRSIEASRGVRFDVVLIIEPTSPLRSAGDVRQALRLLVSNRLDSVVTVSLTSAKFHPRKALVIVDEGADEDRSKLTFYDPTGSAINGRQQLDQQFYHRNGVCYALTRECLLERQAIITDRTAPLVIDRPVVNIDDPIELEWAEFLWQRSQGAMPSDANRGERG